MSMNKSKSKYILNNSFLLEITLPPQTTGESVRTSVDLGSSRKVSRVKLPHEARCENTVCGQSFIWNT